MRSGMNACEIAPIWCGSLAEFWAGSGQASVLYDCGLRRTPR